MYGKEQAIPILLKCILVISFVFITDLQDTTLALDFRVTILEENGGDDGNSSVAELEVRVETLEEINADHETRISAAESDVTGTFIVNYFKIRIIYYKSYLVGIFFYFSINISHV